MENDRIQDISRSGETVYLDERANRIKKPEDTKSDEEEKEDDEQ